MALDRNFETGQAAAAIKAAANDKPLGQEVWEAESYEERLNLTGDDPRVLAAIMAGLDITKQR